MHYVSVSTVKLYTGNGLKTYTDNPIRGNTGVIPFTC